MSKSVLRRLSVQIPESEQPEFLAATFSVEVLRKSLAIAESRPTQDAADLANAPRENGGILEDGFGNITS